VLTSNSKINILTSENKKEEDFLKMDRNGDDIYRLRRVFWRWYTSKYFFAFINRLKRRD